MAGQWQPRTYRQARDGKASQKDERNDADRPPEADSGDEPLEDDREDDAASCTASSREPDGDCTSAPEPVAKDCDGRVEPIIQKIFSR